MSDVLRLVLWLRSAKCWTVLAVVLSLATVVTNTGLLGVAMYLISAAALHPPLLALTGALSLVRLFGLSRAFARYGERLISHDVTFRMLARLRLWLYSRLAALAPGQLLGLRNADLLARLVRDVDDAQAVYQQLIGPLVVALVALLLVGATFWTIDARLGVVATVSFLAVGVGLPVLGTLATRRLLVDQVRRRADLDVRVADALGGLPDLLAFGQTGAHLQATFQLDGASHRAQRRLATIAGLRLAAQDAIVRLGAWGVLLMAAALVAVHGLDATYMAVLAIVLLGAADVVEPLAQAATRLAGAHAAAARMWAIADRRPALLFPAGSGELPSARMLEFQRVGFAYDGSPVLADISFTLRRGQAIGIVGPSGVGKSSLLQLAARAWDPTTGQIRLDGRDLRTYASDAVTSALGLLAQDSYIFSATLRHNLLLARPSATAGDLEQALQTVGLGNLLAELPHGLDTWLGDQGARFSGGERQRLALARVLLLDTPLLLLDEPTANLDPISERTVIHALRAASRTRGILLVTHHLLELDWMDELLVLDAGRIVERGRPAELRRAGGLYARLVDVQAAMLAA